jgi:hypothetical protein
VTLEKRVAELEAAVKELVAQRNAIEQEKDEYQRLAARLKEENERLKTVALRVWENLTCG